MTANEHLEAMQKKLKLFDDPRCSTLATASHMLFHAPALFVSLAGEIKERLDRHESNAKAMCGQQEPLDKSQD